MNVSKLATCSGLSQLAEKSIASGSSPDTALPMATATNSARAASWMPTRTYWTSFVVVMPR